MEAFEVGDLEIYLSGLSRIFDSVRIVDPGLNKVVHMECEKETIDESSCFDFWDKNIQCKNCISRDAARENITFSKIEYNNDGMFLVMATPIIFEGRQLIVEMIKNICFIDEIYGENMEEITGITGVISNLNEKLIKDPLTDVYNRRYINKTLGENIKTSQKNKENLSVIMLDIDSFKAINDLHGHMAGDLALKNLASVIKSNIRNNYDWVARFGGDEFVLVLKNADDKVSSKIMKNIQSSLKEKVLVYKDTKIEMTVSMGGYIVNDKEKTLEEVFYFVDKNLNIAKNNGKNTFVIS